MLDRGIFLGKNGPRLSKLIVLFLCLAAQAAPAPKPIIPAAVNSIVERLDTYVGQTVTITAPVELILSPVSFTVDQDSKGTSTQLLVIAPVLNAPLTPNAYVTVIGEVGRHDGGPAIQATSVLTAAGVDLAKRIPPPLTADEAAFDKVMKGIGPAFNALRQALGSPAGADAPKHAATLKAGFIETEAFFKKGAKADAQKWASEARTHVDALDRAIAAAKWDEARAAVGSLQQTCSACHGTYRERLDDGSYRLRGN